jgi:hypothetical protein
MSVETTTEYELLFILRFLLLTITSSRFYSISKSATDSTMCVGR